MDHLGLNNVGGCVGDMCYLGWGGKGGVVVVRREGIRNWIRVLKEVAWEMSIGD